MFFCHLLRGDKQSVLASFFSVIMTIPGTLTVRTGLSQPGLILDNENCLESGNFEPQKRRVSSEMAR